MNQQSVAAIDIGHSEVKVSGPKGQFTFPSFACPAVVITDPAEAARAAKETVNIDGRDWFFGKTAILQSGGVLSNGLSDTWVETPEHTALLVGALQKLSYSGVNLEGGAIALGLPSRLHQRQKDALREIARRYVAAEILVLPQPIGPYYAAMLDEDGRQYKERPLKSASWAVVDIGYYTTDFLLMCEGRWIEAVKDSVKGAHIAAAALQRILRDKNYEIDLAECEQALQTKYIRHFGQVDVSAEVSEAVSVIVSEVVDKAGRILAAYVSKIDGVVIAGGGAYLVSDALKNKWSNAVMADNPRMAVAEGFRRFALGYLRARRPEAVA